jgi:hypothetical protein
MPPVAKKTSPMRDFSSLERTINPNSKKGSTMLTSPLILSPVNSPGMNKTTVGGFSFLTSVPVGPDGEHVDLLDFE